MYGGRSDKPARPLAGVEHPAQTPKKTADSGWDGAESGALGAQRAEIDPDLAAVIDAWPDLPPAVKAGIAAMVKVAKGGR